MLRRPRAWYALAALLTVLALFVLGGAAGGLAGAAAMGAFIVGAFLSLRGERPEDRTAGTGIFGGWL